MGLFDDWKHCPRCGAEISPNDGRAECSACGYVAYANPAPAVCALLTDRDGRILLTRRRWEPYAGETRDDRLREFHEENRRPVLGLREGAWLRLEGRRLALGGGAARLFRRGRPPRSFRPGAELGFLLGS